MAKKNSKTYKINSEIINTEATFGTIKEAREFIAAQELPENVKTSKEVVALGTIDGYKGQDQVNTTPVRFEKNTVKFGRTSKIESETEVIFTPSPKLNDMLNNDEIPAEDEIENADETIEDEDEIENETEMDDEVEDEDEIEDETEMDDEVEDEDEIDDETEMDDEVEDEDEIEDETESAE